MVARILYHLLRRGSWQSRLGRSGPSGKKKQEEQSVERDGEPDEHLPGLGPGELFALTEDVRQFDRFTAHRKEQEPGRRHPQDEFRQTEPAAKRFGHRSLFEDDEGWDQQNEVVVPDDW